MEYRTYGLMLIVAGTALMLVLLFGFERTRIGAHPRRGRQPAHGAIDGRGRRPPVHADLRAGQRAGGGGRRPGRRDSRPRSAVSIRYLAYFLIVVAVGGLGRISGVFFAAILFGVLDFVLKIYFPKGGTLFIYALTLVLLLARPQGLFGKKGI
jgi:branched-chain amino acid transport system permease protein